MRQRFKPLSDYRFDLKLTPMGTAVSSLVIPALVDRSQQPKI